MNGHPKNASLFVKVINSFAAHTNDVLSVAWTGNILASGSADKTIRLWKITKKQEGHMELEEAAFSPVKDHVYHVQCLHFSLFGVFLAECSSDGVILVWDTVLGKKVAAANLPAQNLSAARTCRISGDSRFVAAGGDSDCVALWNFERNQGLTLLKVFYGHEASVTCLSFTHDSKLLLSGSIAGDIRIWDCVDFRDQPVKVQKDAHDLGCTCMDIAPYKANMPNGDTAFHIATGGYDNTIKLWHLLEQPKRGTKFLAAGTLHGHSADICSLRFANQAKLIISCSSDRTLCIWDPIKCVALKRIGPLTRYMRCCSFSSDDKFIMTGFSGGIIGFWNVAEEGKVLEEQSIIVGRSAAELTVHLDFLDEYAPNEFLCPITHEIMKDPVVTSDGISYERAAIETWFRNHDTSPQTNLLLPTRVTVPNMNLKLLIQKWLERNKKGCSEVQFL